MKTFLKVFILSFFCFFAAYSLGSFAYLKENNVKLEEDIGFGFYEDVNIGKRILTKLEKLPKEPKTYFTLEEAMENSSIVNFLVLGMDGERSDTIMVVSLDPDAKKINLISVPRDTYIHRKGYDAAEQRKINSVYQVHGIEGVKKTISYLLEDMPIDHYIILDYAGVEKLVDLVGGVEVDVPFKMEYEDETSIIDIPAGKQVLDGKNALDFIRYRKGYLDGDLGRLKAQQEFLTSFATKGLKNITTMVTKGIEYVRTDVTLLESLHYGRSLLGMDKDDLKFIIMPGKASFKDINRKVLSYYIHNPKEGKKILEEIYNVQDTN